MKFLFFILCIPVVLLGSTPKIKVVTSTSIFQDMIQNTGGGFVEVTSIVPRGSDPHRYEPKPSDVALCRDADIIMINGLHLEVWIEKLIKNSKIKANVVIITEGIEAVKSLKSTDPHAWMTAKNGIIYAENIAAALIRFKPHLKTEINANLNTYTNKLKELDDFIRAEIAKIPASNRILVSNHDAFQYFGKHYNMKLVPLMGISTEAEPKTSDIIRIMQAVKKSGIRAIFVETSVNPRTMEQLASDLNISLGGSLFSDSLGETDGPAGTYIGMLKTNTNIIVKALLPRENESSDTRHSSNTFLPVYYLLFVGFLVTMTALLAKKIIK